MPYLGKSPSFGVRERYKYTATASQTTFSGTDTANLTLNYTDNNFVDVYQNGVLLKGGGNDYTATSGTSVVLATGATADDVIEIIVYDAFSAANFYSRTDSDSRYQTTLAGIDDQSSSNDDQNKPESLHYGHMVALCVKSIQELKTELDDAKARIATLESK